MINRLALLIALLLLAVPARAATYSWYFSDDATGDLAEGSDAAACSEAAPCKSISKINSMIASMTNGTDTATIYMDRADTWTLTSDVGIRVGKSNVTITAYGTGAKPIIDGDNAYPANTGTFVIGIGNNTFTSAQITNCHVSYIEIKNTWNGNLSGGGGIQFAGINKDSHFYTGPGSVKFCKISNTGKAPISIYGVANPSGTSGAILIENNEITAGNQVDKKEIELDPTDVGWPQNISTLDSRTYGHECRYNRIYDTFGEGIGVNGFRIVEYNVISNTSAPALYIAMPSTTMTSAWDTTVRYNLIFNSADAAGISYNDEQAVGSNTAFTCKIYGNIIINGYYGIQLRNQAGTSNYGPVYVYNNTIIDCLTNISIGHGHTFNAVYFANNASIISSDAAASCRHIGVFSTTGWTGWTVGPNYYFGDSISSAAVDSATGTTIFSNANDVYETATHPLPTTSGWRALETVPAFATLYPGAASGLIDQTETDATIGAEYNSLFTTGTDFTALPDTVTIVRVNQGDHGTDHDFGAVIYSDETTPDPPDPPASDEYILQADYPATKDSVGNAAFGDDAARTYIGGSFTTVTGYDLRRVTFTCGGVVGSPAGTYTAYVYSHDAVNNEPDTLLGTSTNTVSASGLVSGSEMDFDFAAITLADATVYWAVIKANTVSASAYIRVRYDTTSTTRVSKSSDASSWTYIDSASAIYVKTYTYEAVAPPAGGAVVVTDLVLIVSPDGTPSVIDNPAVTISNSTRRYIGIEISRPIVVVLNPEAAYGVLTGPDSRVEYCYYYRYLEVDSRYFLVFYYDPPALPGDRLTDLSFAAAEFVCNGSSFTDSDANDLCTDTTPAITRTDIGGTGSVNIAVPKNQVINSAYWTISTSWAADAPATITAYDTFIVYSSGDTISVTADNLVFVFLNTTGTYDVTLGGDNCTVFKMPGVSVTLTDNGSGNTEITKGGRRRR